MVEFPRWKDFLVLNNLADWDASGWRDFPKLLRSFSVEGFPQTATNFGPKKGLVSNNFFCNHPHNIKKSKTQSQKHDKGRAAHMASCNFICICIISMSLSQSLKRPIISNDLIHNYHSFDQSPIKTVIVSYQAIRNSSLFPKEPVPHFDPINYPWEAVNCNFGLFLCNNQKRGF